MKKKTIIAILLLLCLPVFMGAYLETRQNAWIPLRAAVTSDDTALDGTTSGYTYAFADKPTKAVALTSDVCGGQLFFSGTTAADKVCNYKVYCWKANGPAFLWCYGVATTGTAVTGATTTFYCDTITSTNVVGTTTVIDSGNNRVAILDLGDLRGMRYIYIEVDIQAAGITAFSADFTSF